MSHRKTSANLINVSSVKTNQNNHTPASRKNSKSPFSNSKCCHQSNQQQTVSYGQLQIVLENVQAIKQKASAQVKLLSEENSQLKEELQGYRESNEDIVKLKREWEIGNRDLEAKWREKVEERELQIRKKMNTIEEKDSIIRKLEKSQQTLQQNNERLKQELDQLKQKWKWAFDILAGDEAQAQDLVWKIKHSNCSTWQLLQTKSSLSNMFELSKQKIESLTQQLIRVKEEHDQTSKMLEKALTELNNSTNKMAAIEEKIQEYSEYLVAAKEQNYELEKKLKTSLHENDTLAETIMNLEHQIDTLSHQIAIKKEIESEKEKKSQYDALVSDLCDETQDYTQVLERVRYLQKFRSEHYRNIEKIQYLCKQLAS